MFAGTGLTASSAVINLDINGLTIGRNSNLYWYMYDADATAIKNIVADLPFTNNSGDITSVGVTAGTGLTGGGSASSGAFSATLALDFSGLTDMTGDISGTTNLFYKTELQNQEKQQVKLNYLTLIMIVDLLLLTQWILVLF